MRSIRPAAQNRHTPVERGSDQISGHLTINRWRYFAPRDCAIEQNVDPFPPRVLEWPYGPLQRRRPLHLGMEVHEDAFHVAVSKHSANGEECRFQIRFQGILRVDISDRQSNAR